MWDERSLGERLRRHGFVDIRRAAFGDADDPRFAEVEELSRFDGYLAMQCRKVKPLVLAALLVLLLVPIPAVAQQPPRIDMPMTAGERIAWIVDGTVGPKSLGVGVIAAAWNTAWNMPEEWRQT